MAYRPSAVYDWLLFIHIVGAFALVAAMVVYWAAVLATRGEDPATRSPLADALMRPANVLVIAGITITLVFGVWLAIHVDGYELWDPWILVSLVLWAIGAGTGQRSGTHFTAAAEALTEGERFAGRRRAIVLLSVSTAAVLAVLMLMIFKPGGA